MDINSILETLDQFYSQNDIQKAYQYILEQLNEAMAQNRDDIVLSLLSELIGYYRVTAQFELGNQICEQALKILKSTGLEDTHFAATTYLNIATLLRAQAKYQDALYFYEKTEEIYSKTLDESDERYASFYNNISLLYQELGELDKALEYEQKALSSIEKIDDCRVEEAVTYTNLSQIYFLKKDYINARKCLNRSIDLFKTHAPKDPHYFATLASLAQSYYLEQDYQKALDIYDQVLDGIERVFGKNKDYKIVLENKNKVEKEMSSIKGIKLCEEYYEAYGKKMLEEFPEIKDYIAVGLCGFGSDCLGYDDEISRDHDYGPGFCIWLPRDIYRQYGAILQDRYEKLPQSFRGIKRLTSNHGQGRVGVFCIDDYFLQFIGRIPQTLEDWLYIDENGLIACTNGEIFEDHYHVVSRLRETLHYYPEDIRLKKLARAIAKMAQSGQYNYLRCMKRQDKIAAMLALSEFIDQTLSAIYLLNKKYKPYYKWSYYGLKDCKILNDVQPLLLELIETSTHQDILIEKICQKVITELKHQGLTDIDDDFLDGHAYRIMLHIQDERIKQKHVMEG